MKARKHRADDLRHPVGDLVGVFRDAAKRHVAALDLQLLGLLERAAERLGDLLRDRVAGVRNGPRVDLLVLDKDQVRRLRADVENDVAARKTRIRVAQRVQHRHLRDVNDDRL